MSLALNHIIVVALWGALTLTGVLEYNSPLALGVLSALHVMSRLAVARRSRNSTSALLSSLAIGSLLWFAAFVAFGAPLATTGRSATGGAAAAAAAAAASTTAPTTTLSQWTPAPSLLSTALFAVLQCSLTWWPASVVSTHGVRAWPALFVRVVEPRLWSSIVLPAWGAALGAWLGAIVVPLDWDRAWQVWPTPCVLGAICGHTFALAMATLL